MHLSNWLIFCSVALLVTFTPGPAGLLAVSNSVAIGLRSTIVSSLGNALGLFIVSGVAMAGMGVVLAASAAGFTVLKVIGALYLVYLGVRQWRSKTSAVSPIESAPVQGTAAHTPRRLFGQGLVVALTNPKSILFFSALFPQFITPDAPALGQFLILTTTFAAFALLSHAFYVMLARALKGRFENPRQARLFNRISGGVFVVLGLSLLRLRSKAAA